MQIFVSQGTMAQLFSGALTILVPAGLRHLLPHNIEPACSVIEFDHDTIGHADGPKVPLDANRLPASIGLVVAPEGSAFGRSLQTLLQQARHPAPPKIVSVGRLEFLSHRARNAVHAHVAQLLATRLGDALHSPVRLERDITALRDELAKRDASLDRLGTLLDMVGLHHEELAIDALSSADLLPVALPLTQDIARSLHNLRRISLYKTSPGLGRIDVAISIAGSTQYSTTLEAPEGAGWLDLVLPESLILSVQNAELRLSSVLGQVELAGDRTTGAAALRFWWDGPASDAASPSTVLAPPPPLIFPLPEAPPLVPLARGLWLQPGTLVSLAASRSHKGPLQLRLVLIPHGETPASADEQPWQVLETKPETLSVTSPDRAGRFDLALEILDRATASGRVEWSSIRLVSPEARRLNSYASAQFASLHSAIDFCDGPQAEQSLNIEVGFAVVAASDGNGYMQTHPVQDRIVGARLDSVVPLGTTRLWVDIANAHPSADTIEFVLAVRRDVLEGKTQDWIRGLALPPHDGMAVTDLDGGDIIVRVLMAPGSSRALDIMLPQPLAFQGQLYCLVDSTGRSNRFGWCRWNAIGFAVDAEQALPLIP